MYFAHKLAQLPVPAIAANGWTDRHAQTCTETHTHTQTHASSTCRQSRHVVMSYDMLCRKSEQYLCLETRKKTRKEKTHTDTHTHKHREMEGICVCRTQDAVKMRVHKLRKKARKLF